MVRRVEHGMAEARQFVLNGRIVQLWFTAANLATRLTSVGLIGGGAAHPRREPGESHTVPTLVACLQGVVRVESGGRPFDLQAGEAVLIAPGAWHRHAPLKGGSASLGQGFMLGRSDMELSVPGQAWWLAIPEQPSRDLLTRACAAGARERLALVRGALAGLGEESARPVTPMPEAVQRMWLYLRRERLAPIRAADVLRASGLGPTRAHVLFSGYFAETPHRMLTRHRLEYACHLLATGGEVGAVAARCGFRSRRQFTAAFRTAFAVSPRAWAATRGG
jgi:AraC-like DNA-binding protein